MQLNKQCPYLINAGILDVELMNVGHNLIVIFKAQRDIILYNGQGMDLSTTRTDTQTYASI